MATVTKTIGTSGRDYSTIASWEADLDNASLYSAGDDAVGECYDDSVFDERPVINGGSTVGLNAVTLTAASGERHDGTAATGVRVAPSSGVGNVLHMDFAQGSGINQGVIEWIEADINDTYSVYGIVGSCLSGTAIVRNALSHGGGSSETYTAGISSMYVCNSIVYAITGDGLNVRGISIPDVALNCTIHDIENANETAGNAHGIYANDFETTEIRNTICTDVAGLSAVACFWPSSPAAATMDHNLSSDTTASGAGSLTNRASSDQFVSTAVGSEDLHLKEGADAIDAGADLGTTPSGVEIDIDGYDRDAGAGAWDIGADEYGGTGQPGGGQPAMRRWGGVPGMRVSPLFARSW